MARHMRDYVGKRADAEAFAFGRGEYGFPQEYMFLDNYCDIIKL
jgi:hypothetical protein